MSSNQSLTEYVQYNNPTLDPRQIAREIYREERIKEKRKSAGSAWYAPNQEWEDGIRPMTIHSGEQSEWIPGFGSSSIPAFDVRVDLGIRKEIQRALQEGGEVDSNMRDKLAFKPYIGEFKDYANNYFHTVRKLSRQKVAAGGVVLSDDNNAVQAINVLAQILGINKQTYLLAQNAVRTIATPKLTLSVDQWSGFNAFMNVGEAVEVFVQKGRLARQTYALKKDVGHIAFSDESLMTADRPIQQIHIDHVRRDMERIKNVKVGAAIVSLPDVASTATFNAYTGDRSTIDPTDIIGTVQDLIDLNNGQANTIVSTRRVYHHFQNNTHINGEGNASPTRGVGNGIIQNVRGLDPRFTWIIDNSMPATEIAVYDIDSIILMQGPVRLAQYRKEGQGIDAYISRDWNGVAILDDTQGRNITGVAPTPV